MYFPLTGGCHCVCASDWNGAYHRMIVYGKKQMVVPDSKESKTIILQVELRCDVLCGPQKIQYA